MEEKKNSVMPDEELDAVSGGKRVQFESVELTMECPHCHNWVTPTRLDDRSLQCPKCNNKI